MSDGGGSNFVELTVIRADGLEHHQRRGYFVECSNGVETHKTKTRKQSGKDWVVEWLETLSFTIDDTSGSKFSIRVYIKNLPFVPDDEKACADLVLSDHKADEEIKLQLASPDHKKPKSSSGVLTIKFKLIAQATVLDRVVHNVTEASLQVAQASDVRLDALGKVHAIGSGAKQIASAAESWGSLVDNIEFFANFVSAISEIHPYAKAALSIVKGVTEVFIAQIKRDDNILDLVGTMNDTYDLIREGDSLANRDTYKKQFNVMALQTLECGYFIQTYVKDSFFKRAVLSLNPRIDRTIKNFQAQFEKLTASFQNYTLLDSTIQVYRVMDAVENLGITIDLNDITYAEGMRYQVESCCLPETRKDILEMIVKWADDVDSTEGSRVFLLTGLAGSGKSSIAHSVAQHFDNLHRLGSSFFCNRTKAANSRPEKIFCTIARDIADREEQAKQKLAMVVKSNRSLSKTTSVKEQFDKFLKGSTEGLTMVGPMAIVIDALDECEGDGRLQEELMNMLAKEASTLPKNIRVFLTARSGDQINNTFKNAPLVRRYSMDDIQDSSTESDILVLIDRELSSMADKLSECDTEWKVGLMKMAGGLFILAATACKFINEGIDPKSRFRKMLSDNHGTTNPIEALYKTYKQILKSALDPEKVVDEEMELYRTTLGVILGTLTPISTKASEALTGVECQMVVSKLGSVLTGSTDPEQPVKVLHTSFRDYLTTRSQSGNYFINPKYHQAQMAKYCLDLMNRELKFNVCSFEDLYILYDDIPAEELAKRTTSNISEALQYVCRYWPLHIVQMDSGDYDIIKEPLHRFLFVEKHLMQWIEVVSMLKMMDVVLKSINGLVKWFQEHMQIDGKTHRMLYDCFRLLDNYSYAITQGPLQIYQSAQPYIPAKTALHDVYSEISDLEPRVRVIFGREEDWSSLRSKLQMTPLMSDNVIAAAFSPDGARIACASRVGKLQIFDFATSAALGEPVECSVVRIHALVFSPDGIHLAISTPDFIEVWNAETKACLVHDTAFTMRGRLPIAFLSNNLLVACRVNGRRVELWSRSLSNVDPTIHTFLVDQDVRLVVMSPSGRFFGYLTESGNVFVWDTQSQEEIAHFKVDRPGKYLCALGISSDGEYIAASNEDTVTMWSRSRGEIIWEKESGEFVREILMPLSTDCGRFVTSFMYAANYVWDFATGNHYKQMSFKAKAVSADGHYFVTKDGDIYSIEDADQPHWEPSSVAGEADANKPSLLEGEELTHMLFLSDGSLSAAGSNGNTVFTWDGLGTVDARKYMLEGHALYVWDVKISPDGLKLASWDANNVLMWNRKSMSMQFDLELRETLRISKVQMAFAPDGSLILALVTEDGTISVWEQFGTANVVNYTLETHMAHNVFVNFSADGMKIASLSKDNTVFVSAKQSPVARFELSSTHKFENEDSAQHYLEDPSRWEDTTPRPATMEHARPDGQLLPISAVGSGELASKPFFRYGSYSEWVTTAEGKRLWWIPEHFRAWGVTQLGNRIVVYTIHTVVLFTYADNAISNRTT